MNNKGIASKLLANATTNKSNPKKTQDVDELQASIDPIKLKYYERFLIIDWKKSIPTEYVKVAKALKSVLYTKNVTLSSIIDPNKSNASQEMFNLCVQTKVRNRELTFLLKKFNIVKDNKKILDEWTAKVLISELLWGTQMLKSNCKEVQTIRYYEESLRDSFIRLRDTFNNPNDAGKLGLPIYIRINTLTITIDACLNGFKKEGWTLLPRAKSYSEYIQMLSNIGKKEFLRDYHISELLAFPSGTKFYQHPGFLKGKFIYQDKGSCLSSFLLNPKPDSVVLDVGAAPGIKTNHLANIMENSGKIYAVENHPERFKSLEKLLNLTEVKNVTAINDGYQYIDIPKDQVKYILIDYTSSYSGIFFSVNDQQKPEKYRLKYLKGLQSEVLRHSLQTYHNVKRLIYTVCSVYMEEGEEIVSEALNAVGDSYTLLDTKEMLWNEWESMSSSDFPDMNKCLRIVPEIDLCQGYFIAVFERNFDVPIPEYKKNDEKSFIDFTQDLDETEQIFIKKQNSEKNLLNYSIEQQIVDKQIAINDLKQRKIMLLQDRMEQSKKQKAEILARKKQFISNSMRWQNPKKIKKTKPAGLLPTPEALLPTPSLQQTLVSYPNQNLMLGQPSQKIFSQTKSTDHQNVFASYNSNESTKNLFSNERKNVFEQSNEPSSHNVFSESSTNESQSIFSQLKSTTGPLRNMFAQPHQSNVDRPSAYSYFQLTPNKTKNLFSQSRSSLASESQFNEHTNVFSKALQNVTSAESQWNVFSQSNDRQNFYNPSNEPKFSQTQSSDHYDIYSQYQPNESHNVFTQSEADKNCNNFNQSTFSQTIIQQSSQSTTNRSSTSYPNIFSSERIIEKTHNQLWP